MIKSAYVHVPFCRQKCGYCSFTSFCDTGSKDEYVKVLCDEIGSRYHGEPLQTLYFGGGTPSLLGVEDFQKIISIFDFEPGAEITSEANPEKLTTEYLSGLKEVGVNRLSLGVQSFDDKMLEKIGRKHSAKDVFDAMKSACDTGFENISVDLMYGLPGQSAADFEKSLKTAISLNIEHISSYGLKIEEGCRFFQNPPHESLPDDEVCAEMFFMMVETLENAGFRHYEISNFAKPGFESRHNLAYWNCSEYYGFGCSASGYEAGTRYTNTRNLKEYLADFGKKSETVVLSDKDKFEEEIFLGLRKADGICVKALNERFDTDFDRQFGSVLKKYDEFFERKDGRLCLNDRGIVVCNYILSEFI